MKTTSVLDDTVVARLKQEAARRGTTVSALVESAVRAFLKKPRRPTELPPLPVFDGGGCVADVADRDALYQAMEGR
ncbi:MAG: ribbon-helix-helix domain-containing protein [Planctomycetota bacterium]|nr:ribbon-helix-helix domain-containing protein [Planctomycetota bacterium]